MREKELSVDMLLAEIIRLRELCKDAAEEIRYLDNILMECFYDNRPPRVDNPVDFGTFSSVNLISRLDGRFGPSMDNVLQNAIDKRLYQDQYIIHFQSETIEKLQKKVEELSSKEKNYSDENIRNFADYVNS